MLYNPPTTSSLEDNPDIYRLMFPPLLSFSPGLSTLQSFHFPSQSETSKDDVSRKRKSIPRKTTCKVVKVASSKDLAVSPSFSTQTPSERKLGPLSPKVPVPTFNINVRSEDEKIKSKKVRLAEGYHIMNIHPWKICYRWLLCVRSVKRLITYI